MHLDPNQLAALAAILRLGSFEAAAAELHVTASAVSQRLKALEDRLGAVLVHRTSPCTATVAGHRLARHAQDLGLLEQGLARDLGLAGAGDSPARVSLAVTADSLATWVLPALADLPDLLFDLMIDDQDHSADWLRRGAVAAAISADPKPAPGCQVRPLGRLRYVAAAQPAFLAHWFPQGPTPKALARAPSLRFNAKDQLQTRWIRAACGQAVSPPSHGLPSSQGFVDAAILGLGWGMIPLPQAAPELAAGRLALLAPDLPLDTALHFQSIRVLGPALDRLGRALQKAARRVLLPPD